MPQLLEKSRQTGTQYYHNPINMELNKHSRNNLLFVSVPQLQKGDVMEMQWGG